MSLEEAASKLTDKQVECVEAFRNNTHRIILSLGWNRSGKSYAAGIGVADAVRQEIPPNKTVWFVSPNQEISRKGQQKAMWNLLPRDRLFDGPGRPSVWTAKNGFDRDNPTVTYDPGGRNITLRFKTGAQYNNDDKAFEAEDGLAIIWIDESVESAVFEACAFRLLSTSGKMWISTIPNVEWIDDVEHAEKMKVLTRHFHPSDNPAIDMGVVDEVVDMFKHSDTVSARMGESPFRGRLVYKEFVNKPLADGGNIVTAKDVPEDVAWYGAMDIGADHPTCFLLLAVDRDGKIYIFNEYAARHTRVEDDATAIKAIIGSRQLAMPIVIDKASAARVKGMAKPVIWQYRDAGLSVRPSKKKSTAAELSGVQIIREAFYNKDLLVCDRCTQTIRELCRWKLKRNNKNEPVTSGSPFEDRNNDCLDALRYIMEFHPTYRGKGSWGVESYV